MKRLVFAAAATMVTALAACASADTAPTAAVAAAPAAAASTPSVVGLPAGAYQLDTAHASLLFRIDHLSFSRFTGRFAHWTVALNIDPQHPEAASVTATIDPNSLESDNPPAGFLAMLRGAQWLNAPQFPEMTFRSTHIEMTGANTARITGDFSFHGVTRPLALEATFNGGYAGNVYDPHARIGFSAHGVVKRSEYGLSVGLPPPGTNMGVGDDVEFIIECELSGPDWTAPAAQSHGSG